MAIENILKLPELGYVDREQFSALASGPHKNPGQTVSDGGDWISHPIHSNTRSTFQPMEKGT